MDTSGDGGRCCAMRAHRCGVRVDDGKAGVLWIQCSNDLCEVWVHAGCYGIEDGAQVAGLFLCDACSPSNQNAASGPANLRRRVAWGDCTAVKRLSHHGAENDSSET